MISPTFRMTPTLRAGLSLGTLLLAPATAQSWVTESPATSPAPNAFCKATTTADNAAVLMLEGNSGTNLTWRYQDGDWTQLTPMTSPPARFGHAMATPGIPLMFGGVGLGAPGVLDDTWSFVGQNWVQQNVVDLPPARWGHAMADFGPDGLAVMFGGADAAGGLLDDTWLWDGATWQPIITEVRPAPRMFHAMCTDPQDPGNSVLLYGGNDLASNAMGDFWRFTLNPIPTWTQISAVALPGLRSTHSFTYDSVRDRAVLLGGSANANVPSSGAVAHEWNGAWTVVNPTGTPPAAGSLTLHAAAFDPRNAEHLVFATDGVTHTYGSLVANRPGFTATLAGCNGALARVPGPAPNQAYIGQNVVMSYTLAAPAGAPQLPILWIESNASAVGSTPCLYVTPLSPSGSYLLGPTIPAGGNLTNFTLPIPADPSLVGDLFFLQASGSVGFVAVTTSELIEMTVGAL